MASGETPDRNWKDDTLDYMFRELVKSEKYRYLLSATPKTEKAKVVEEKKMTQEPGDHGDIAKYLFASTPSNKPPTFESYLQDPERPSVPKDTGDKVDFAALLQSNKLGLPDTSMVQLAKVPVPKLPQFSGTDGKGEASYEVWRFEVMCLQKEKIYPDAHILQAIRQSLRGPARDILLTVGETATSAVILEKLNGIYGIVSSNESIIQQFYLEQQKENENVAQYSIRIENMLQKTKDYISPITKNEMLRSKLWNGLRVPQLRNASRFKYEMERDFNRLRIEIRKIEQDMPSKTIPKTASVQQQSVAKVDENQLEEILKRLKAMEGKFEGIEKSIERKIESKLHETSEENTVIDNQSARGRRPTRGYGPNRGYRGRYRGGRQGQRGSLNEKGSTS